MTPQNVELANYCYLTRRSRARSRILVGGTGTGQNIPRFPDFTAVFQNLATAESESHDRYEQSDQPVRSNHFRFPLSCCKVLENRCSRRDIPRLSRPVPDFSNNRYSYIGGDEDFVAATQRQNKLLTSRISLEAHSPNNCTQVIPNNNYYKGSIAII